MSSILTRFEKEKAEQEQEQEHEQEESKSAESKTDTDKQPQQQQQQQAQKRGGPFPKVSLGGRALAAEGTLTRIQQDARLKVQQFSDERFVRALDADGCLVHVLCQHFGWPFVSTQANTSANKKQKEADQSEQGEFVDRLRMSGL